MKLFGRAVTARKAYFAGTHRTRSPGETLAAYQPLMAMTGITRIANVTGLDRIGLPVSVAIRPNSRALATSQGKGETIEAAKASALMEAIESWHAERVGKPVIVESYRHLVGRRAIVDPRQLGVRADATLHLDRPLEWIEGEDLCSGATTLIPYETVSTNFVEDPARPPTFLKSTNGLASGNHVLEAVVHGLLEVIERDALALWELRSKEHHKSRQLDLNTIPSGHLTEVLALLNGKGIRVAAWDITSDVKIPTYTCTLVEDPGSEHWRPIASCSGHGSHFDPQIALSRALHEAIQTRVTMISGSRDDMFPRDYRMAAERHDHARAIEHWSNPPAVWPFPSAIPKPSDSFETDLGALLDRLKNVGIHSVVAVDLSIGGVGVPVIKVIVPGLESVRTGMYRPGARARAMMEATA